MTVEMIDFVRARLDEGEALAKAATPGPWQACRNRELPLVYADVWGWTEYEQDYGEPITEDTDRDTAVFIAHNHPARALADIKLKRRILERHLTGNDRVYSQRCTNADHAQDWQCERAGCTFDVVRWCEICPSGEPCELEQLAALWPEHADFQPHWKPA